MLVELLGRSVPERCRLLESMWSSSETPDTPRYDAHGRNQAHRLRSDRRGRYRDAPTCSAPQTACVEDVPVCMAQCDPLMADACGAREPCVCTDPTGPCLCVQQSLAPAESLESCEPPGECADGLACAPAESLDCRGESCCTPYCDLKAPNPCPEAEMGQMCSPLFAGPAEIGNCTF